LIRDGDNYQIDGLVLSADTPELAFQATGEVSALGTNPQFKIEFETQTDRLKDFLALLDYEIPIDGSGTADGFLIRDGDNYQIDGLVLSADTPELAFQATGEVSALGQTPEFNLGFKLLNLGEIDLSWFWNEQSLFHLGFLTEVTGSVVAAGGTIVASGLSLDFMGQKLLGHFSGRLPLLGHSSLADWSLRLTSDDIGELATAFGLDWIYPEHGELNVQVRPSVNRDYDFQLQVGLLANGVNLNISGDMTGFDKNAGFNLRYLINASAFSKNDKIFWDGLNRIGSFRLDGSLIRVKGVREPTTVSLRLNSNKLGVLIAEGSIFSMNSMGSRLDLSIATDSISKFMSVASVRMANVKPFQGDASVRLTNGSVLLDDFHFRVGNNDLFGAIEYRRGVITGTRPSIKADVESAYLNLNELFPPPTKTFLFSEEPLPAGWAMSHDVSVQFKVGRFLRRNYDLRGLVGRVTSLSGVVDAHSRSSAFGGDLELTLNLDTRPTPFKAVYQYNWNDLDLALLPVARKAAPEITGRVDLKGGITGEGRSLHQIVERGDGYLFVDVEQARFLRGGMELFTTSPINIVEQILREVSPWGQREKFFDIECGVIGIRIKNGVGVALPPPEHTIAIKAKEFRLAGFGDLQLSDESLSLSVRSKARGLGFSSATLIEQSGLSAIYPPFYRIAGSLLSPKVESDPEGSDLVETLLKLGSAYVTGGTSVALLGLIDRLAIEPVGCEGARDRALKLVPK
jgi:hypothetical protein